MRFELLSLQTYRTWQTHRAGIVLPIRLNFRWPSSLSCSLAPICSGAPPPSYRLSLPQQEQFCIAAPFTLVWKLFVNTFYRVERTHLVKMTSTHNFPQIRASLKKSGHFGLCSISLTWMIVISEISPIHLNKGKSLYKDTRNCLEKVKKMSHFNQAD